MANAAYHSETDSLSTSQFKLFLASPAEYHATFVTGELQPKESSSAMDLGTLTHAVLLERKKLDDIVRAYPTSCLKSNGALNSGPAKEFAEKIFPVIAMKEEDIERIEKMVAKARTSELGPILNSNHEFEQRLDATIEGVRCRCKPDIHSGNIPDEDYCVIWDLKTTERITPDDWWRTAKSMGYFVQDAFYSLIAEEVYQKPCRFSFWAIETVKLHRVKPYWYEERSRQIAREFVQKKLQEFAERKLTNNWDDAWEPSASIGPWDLGSQDGELVEWEG